MRLVLFAAVIALGAMIGVFAAAGDDTSTKVTMAFVGVLFALPVAALLVRRRKGSIDKPVNG
jgi:membrane associated rhomboid family serine protease